MVESPSDVLNMSKPIASAFTLALGLVVGLGLGLGLTSCTGTGKNPGHCWYAEGDATCMAEYGTERPYCTAPECPGVDEYLGCVSERPATDECYAPCGGEKTILEDDSCLGVAEESTDSGSESASESGSETASETTTTTETTDPGPCTSNEECDSATPICGDSGTCVGCADTPASDEACAMLDPDTPVCDGANNTCVQCLPNAAAACGGTTPVCDEATSSCVGCDWHEQCAEACQMKTGACMPSNVFEAADADQLDERIAAIAALDPAEGVIHLQASDQTNSVTVPSGVKVAILGVGQSMSNWQGNNNTPALTVEAGAEVYIQGIRIASTQNAGGWGIVVNGGELWLDRSEVVDNDEGGVQVTAGGSVVIRNSFVGGNASDVKAVEVLDGQLSVVFSTLIAGGWNMIVVPAALSCAGGTNVTVRNSILAATSTMPEVVCNTAVIESSVLEDATMFMGNTEMTFVPATWPAMAFGNGDFHLYGAQPAEINTAAVWQPGDPLVDIDGDPRPLDQTPTAAGADLP